MEFRFIEKISKSLCCIRLVLIFMAFGGANILAMTLKEDEEADIYDILNRMAIEADFGDMTIFAGSTFVDNEALFTVYLNKIKNAGTAPLIADIIKGFVYYRFPHGKPSRAARLVLAKILEDPKIPETLAISIIAALSEPSHEDYVQQFRSLIDHKDPGPWIKWSARKIAVALTVRDVILFLSSTPQDFKIWTNNQRARSSVAQIILQSNDTINWVKFQIVKSDDFARKKIVKKFIKVAEELYKLNNFHGLMQIVLALQSEPVQRLCEGTANLNNPKMDKFSKLLNPCYSYKNLKDHQAKFEHTETQLPILMLFFQPLVSLNERYKSICWGSVTSFTKVFKNIAEQKLRCHYKLVPNGTMLRFFEMLPHLTDDDVYVEAFLQKPYRTTTEISMNDNYRSSSEAFVIYLNSIGLYEAIEPLFRAGIYNFTDFSQKFPLTLSRSVRKKMILETGINQEIASLALVLVSLGKENGPLS